MHLKSIVVVVFCFALSGVSSENVNSPKKPAFSTSVAGMRPLLKLEHALIGILEDYADELEDKMSLLKYALDAMRQENKKALENSEKYLSNPLNSFILLRTLHADWPALRLFMANTVGIAQIRKLRKYRAYMPTSTDLKEAASGMLRLQRTYKLNPYDMAKGLLRGKQYRSSLSALDCFSIGVKLLQEKKPYYASLWLLTALHIHQPDELDNIFGFSKLNIVDMYGTALLQQNKLNEALKLLGRALKEFPGNGQLLRWKAKVEQRLLTGNFPEKKSVIPVYEEYDPGCRGEYGKISKLHCRYNSTTTAFLTLAPFKTEELCLDPYLVLFHDVISDREIVEIKKAAEPQLKQAGVFAAGGERGMNVEARAAHSVWLESNTSDTTERINQRIVDMTGFDVTDSEPLQIINYGLGGHYKMHYDPSSCYRVIDEQDDRLATVLFYLNDVEQGGATVFPKIKQAIFPRKGTAIFWYNLNHKGGCQNKTYHGGCPVLVGSKWIASKWINYHSQTFTKPCNAEL